MKSIYFLFVITLFITSCNTLKQPYVAVEKEQWAEASLPTDIPINHTFYLVGEIGSSDIDKNPIQTILKKELALANNNSTVLFLGSQLYPKGLASKGKKRRPDEERRLLSTFDLLENYQGSYFFIAGEHDWEHRGDKGLKAVKRMEDFTEDHLDAKDFFLPENGCGDPIKVKVEDDVVLLFLNTQWWLEDWKNEKKINEGCDVKSRTEFIDEVHELILKNKNKQLIVVMHHPLYSNGVHGGNIPFKYHLFPTTEINSKAYVPMPVLGSLAALHRNISGTKQDLANHQHQMLKQEITAMLIKLKDIIFVAAHDESQQYFHQLDQHFVVSGAAGRDGFARKGGKAEFASAQQGFSKILVYENKDVWLEFYGLKNSKLELLYREMIVKGKSNLEEVLSETDLMVDWTDSITVCAGDIYTAGKAKQFWFGKNYRDIWDLSITVPVLDIEKEGLYPLRKGGGQQSNSMRLEDSEGKQYVFRSVMKSAYKETPEFLRNTWGQNIVQDMMSGSHPYGAFVVPTLSKAANIYYTEPKLVYIPKQKQLGIYNETFGNELYLYEDRPAGNRKDLDGFGNSEKIIGINDLRPKLEGSYKHQVDQEWVLRSRIFDIWLHDWDRHDDQWRWASFKEGEKTIYRPIPRDRDQVFWTFDGPLPFLTSNFVLKKFRTFKYHLKQPKHQSFNAKHFDKYFLNEMAAEDWIAQASFLQEQLTDSVIEKAFEAWPDEVYEKGGDEIVAKLKSRRDDLLIIATKMHQWLSKRVNVLGTENEDRFEIKRLKNGDTKVTVYDLSKEREKKDKYYERTFLKKETQEIRIYGLGDDDEFEIEGKSRKGIKIRIIAGTGDDTLKDVSNVVGLRKFTKLYDEKEGISFNKNKEIENRTSNQYDVNDYNREETFNYNTYNPLVNFGSNFDDGFFLGAGMLATLQGFRGVPYKAKHNIGFSTAFRNGSFTFNYNLDRKNTFHRIGFDYVFNTTLQNPFYVSYYGLGNETRTITKAEISDEEEREKFHFVRLIDYQVSTGMKRTWINNRYTIEFGPSFQSSKVEVIDGRVSEANYIGLTANDKERKNFLGGYFKGMIDVTEKTDARVTDGIKINFDAVYYNQIKAIDNFANIGGNFNYYVSFFKKMSTTFAIRTGAAVNFGDVPFYRTNSLGGKTNLRGYRQNRFSGKYMFYQNLDLRIKFYYWENRIFPFEFGVLGGFDYGRVWEPNEDSDVLHKGYSAGIWISPFKVVNLTFNYNISKEAKLFSFGFGFFF
ncbi:MAG: ShlB/FhaC/HecB family hemolysin secretion/activation protein [Chitinophagales bacterium]